MHFWESNICTDQLDVQEANFGLHSSTESEIISLDAGLRMDGLLAFDFWDLVIEVLGTTQRKPKTTQAYTRETGVKTQSHPR